MRKDFQNIKDLFNTLKTNRERNVSLWNSISKIIGIGVEPTYATQGKLTQGDQRDECIDDPTSAISVNQAGDYLQGVCWGTGDGAITLEPSDDVLELAYASDVAKYFQYITKKLLFHMNHSQAGLNTAMKAYFYDQSGFGTSGIGAFPNNAFKQGIEENALIFRNYGVDNLIIDEGKNGLVDIIFVPYRWRVNRIVNEFAKDKGKISKELLEKLPKAIQDAYKKKDFNQEFNIVQGILPREDYDPKLEGKRGAKYRGVWFLDDNADQPFYEEDYKKLPVAVCRAIKIRGEVYGRSSGTMLIATIRSVNYMVGQCIETIEKLNAPALGMWGNAILGDNVLDSSSQGLTIFNPAFAAGKEPVFQLHDVGDPSGLVKFLIPYLNEKITTAFKIDVLLDFNNDSSKTATEMLQRYAIRGRSLSGMIQQQKTEMLEPLTHRCVSILEDVGVLGVNPRLFPNIVKAFLNRGKTEMIIPDAVLACKLQGKPWYKVKFNNELDKLSRTEKLEALMQMLNVITAIAALYPAIIEAIDWYQLLLDFKDALNIQGNFVIKADEFKAKIAQQAQLQAQMMMLQAGKAGSEIAGNIAGAKKDAAATKPEGGK
ncbi:MAG: portal protein [Candidatus Omnitrophota bacterium]